VENVTTIDGDALERRARFGRLPERVRYEDMVEEHQAGVAAPDVYRAESAWASYNCLAVDLGL
jgi:hypothetical protein